jgi:hypothetical protein
VGSPRHLRNPTYIPDTRIPPEPWVVHISKQVYPGRQYYFNVRTNESKWEFPEDDYIELSQVPRPSQSRNAKRNAKRNEKRKEKKELEKMQELELVHNLFLQANRQSNTQGNRRSEIVETPKTEIAFTGINFQLLPDNAIIRILQMVLQDETDTSQFNLANTGSIRMINFMIMADPSKLKIVDFIDTRVWIQLLISLGVFDNRDTKWCDTIKEYINLYINERRYTSRAHDLIDILKNDVSIFMRDYARELLDKLRTYSSDPEEDRFLLGEMPDILVFTDNEALSRFVKTHHDFKNHKSDIAMTRLSNIKYWDVRKITDMSYLFSFLTSNLPKSIDLTYWDTSNVKNMHRLFEGGKFVVSGITNWNTSKVTDMSYMFKDNNAFNIPLLWNTSNVTNMKEMFRGATNFNQPLFWDTSKVTDMSRMFFDAKSFTFHQSVGGWDKSKTTGKSIIEMFGETRY